MALLMGLALVVLFVTILYYSLRLKRPKNFPPGPPNYPIIGAMNTISSLDADIPTALMKLGDIYGSLCGLYFGKNLNVVINGYEAAQEVLMREEFNARPELAILTHSRQGKDLGIFFSNEPIWKEQRRFTLRHLRDFGFGKSSMEGLIHEEVAECIERFRKTVSEAKDSVTHAHDMFGVSVVNILYAIMCGKRYKYDDEQFLDIYKKVVTTLRAGNPLGNFINDYPILRYFPIFSTVWKDLVSGQINLMSLLDKAVGEHEKTRDENYSRDFIDVYLKEMKNQKDSGVENSTFFRKELVSVCADLFGAGSETTSNTSAFGILYMMLYPEVQEKLQKELDTVVGKNRLPSILDKPSLPYTEAVLTEILRVATIAPINVPHMATRDTTLLGYDIPKGTIMSINLYSIHMDKKYWGDPQVFRPERFLDKNGKFVKPERLLSFGMGKRACPGEPLARMNNFCFFTAMLQNFKFEIPPGHPKPSTVPLGGFTIAPQPFQAKITPRT